MNLQIIKAGANDAEVIALLGRITIHETFGYLFTEYANDLRAYLDYSFAIDKIKLSLDKPENTYWLARADSLPVGYAKIKFPSPTPLITQGKVAKLQRIYVLKEFLGHGIGTPLLQAILAHAADRQIDAVWLDVLQENTRAVRFYERLGFTALGDDTYSIGAQTFTFRLMVLQRTK